MQPSVRVRNLETNAPGRTDEIQGIVVIRCQHWFGIYGFCRHTPIEERPSHYWDLLGSKRGRSPVLRAGWSEPDLSLDGRRISDVRVCLHSVSGSRAATAATGHGPSG